MGACPRTFRLAATSGAGTEALGPGAIGGGALRTPTGVVGSVDTCNSAASPTRTRPAVTGTRIQGGGGTQTASFRAPAPRLNEVASASMERSASSRSAKSAYRDDDFEQCSALAERLGACLGAAGPRAGSKAGTGLTLPPNPGRRHPRRASAGAPVPAGRTPALSRAHVQRPALRVGRRVVLTALA